MKKDFSEAEYANYYNTILNNLCDMEICEDFGPVLQHIREDIFDSGWYGILTFSYDLLFYLILSPARFSTSLSMMSMTVRPLHSYRATRRIPTILGVADCADVRFTRLVHSFGLLPPSLISYSFIRPPTILFASSQSALHSYIPHRYHFGPPFRHSRSFSYVKLKHNSNLTWKSSSLLPNVEQIGFSNQAAQFFFFQAA